MRIFKFQNAYITEDYFELKSNHFQMLKVLKVNKKKPLQKSFWRGFLFVIQKNLNNQIISQEKFVLLYHIF